MQLFMIVLTYLFALRMYTTSHTYQNQVNQQNNKGKDAWYDFIIVIGKH